MKQSQSSVSGRHCAVLDLAYWSGRSMHSPNATGPSAVGQSSATLKCKTNESGRAALQDACSVLAVRNTARGSGGRDAAAAPHVAQVLVCSQCAGRGSFRTRRADSSRATGEQGHSPGEQARDVGAGRWAAVLARAALPAAAVGFAVAERAWTCSAPRHGSAILTSRPSSSPRILAAGRSHVPIHVPRTRHRSCPLIPLPPTRCGRSRGCQSPEPPRSPPARAAQRLPR